MSLQTFFKEFGCGKLTVLDFFKVCLGMFIACLR